MGDGDVALACSQTTCSSRATHFVVNHADVGDTLHLLPSLYAFEVIHVKAATASLDSQSTFLPSSSSKRSPTPSDGAPSPQRSKRGATTLSVPSPQTEVKLRKQLKLKGHAVPLAAGWQCYADSVLIKEFGAVKVGWSIAQHPLYRTDTPCAAQP